MSKRIARGGGWTTWNGGECPVADGTHIEVMFRGAPGDGDLCEVEDDWEPTRLRWSWHESLPAGDIIAYRVKTPVAVEPALNALDALSRSLADVKFKSVREGMKPSNPKDAIGCDKLPIHLWPATATAMGSIGLLNGMLKYGRSNWRVTGVRASIYIDAAKRHLDAWFEGEECDLDDGVPHLSAALACLAIIVDADAAGMLNDDRCVKGGYRKIVDQMTPFVSHLKAHHATKSPRHYTIADS